MPSDEPSVRPVTPPEETVEFTATNPEDIFTAAGRWLTEQRRISRLWNLSYADYHYGPHPTRKRVEHTLTLHLERDPDDGRLPDGSRPTMTERLPWPLQNPVTLMH